MEGFCLIERCSLHCWIFCTIRLYTDWDLLVSVLLIAKRDHAPSVPTKRIMGSCRNVLTNVLSFDCGLESNLDATQGTFRCKLYESSASWTDLIHCTTLIQGIFNMLYITFFFYICNRGYFLISNIFQKYCANEWRPNKKNLNIKGHFTREQRISKEEVICESSVYRSAFCMLHTYIQSNNLTLIQTSSICEASLHMGQ